MRLWWLTAYLPLARLRWHEGVGRCVLRECAVSNAYLAATRTSTIPPPHSEGMDG